MKGETEASFRCLLTFDADGSLPLFTGAVEGIVVPVVIEKKREAAEKKSQNPQHNTEKRAYYKRCAHIYYIRIMINICKRDLLGSGCL